MAKYKLKDGVACVTLLGVPYRSETNPVFNTDGKFRGYTELLDSAVKAGFLVKIEEPKKPEPVKSKDKK